MSLAKALIWLISAALTASAAILAAIEGDRELRILFFLVLSAIQFRWSVEHLATWMREQRDGSRRL
jgi:hypothetical protein